MRQQINNNLSPRESSVNRSNMENKSISIEGTELVIYNVNVQNSGYGHKKITVTFIYRNDFKDFTATTNNMPDCDTASELEGHDRDVAYYEIIKNSIYDAVVEWVNSVD
ncbi:MAG: hypothetical protein RLY43_1243 [Bacteroidota bacterium]